MTRAEQLQADMHALIVLAVEMEHHAHDSDCARDMLTRLHDAIRSTRREILIADATALLRAASTFGGLQ